MKPFGIIFWAAMMVLAGLVILVKHLGGFRFSSGSVIFGLFVILLGVSLLTGGWSAGRTTHAGNHMIFSSGVVTPDEKGEYNILFSSGTVDLRQTDCGAGGVEINVIFSSAQVLLPEGAVRIKASAVFGQVTLPDGGSVTFGDRSYETEGGDPLPVEINCVFGSVGVS